jgi:hypothetical protein
LKLFTLWTVYNRPVDYPKHFVARRFEVQPGGRLVTTDDVLTGETLDGVREQLPRGLHRVVRQPGDLPSIMETWI